MGVKKYRITVTKRNNHDGAIDVELIQSRHATGVRAARQLYDRALQAACRFGYIVTAYQVTKEGEIRTSL